MQDFDRILASIPDGEKPNFSKDKVEMYYRDYLCQEYDDAEDITSLKELLQGKDVLILAPGRSIKEHKDSITEILDKEVISVSVNFVPSEWDMDYVFSNNMKRFRKIDDANGAKTILTSNISEDQQGDFKVSFGRFAGEKMETLDNSGFMLLRILKDVGAHRVFVAGMDGYDEYYGMDYYDQSMEYSFNVDAKKRNASIAEELDKIRTNFNVEFVTPTNYDLN